MESKLRLKAALAEIEHGIDEAFIEAYPTDLRPDVEQTLTVIRNALDKISPLLPRVRSAVHKLFPDPDDAPEV